MPLFLPGLPHHHGEPASTSGELRAVRDLARRPENTAPDGGDEPQGKRRATTGERDASAADADAEADAEADAARNVSSVVPAGTRAR
ncbi:hypothetical protein [Streptomyces sp. NPDC006270]|uniref:hypothetical protein n=1 Tax=Streptomyces sp. NPDC006270 TaxID=3364741 RepID=UPI00369B1918